MQLKIRRYTGLNSYSFGEIAIQNVRYEIAIAHSWQKASWRIVRLKPKEVRYIFHTRFTDPITYIADSNEQECGHINKSELKLIEFQLADQQYQLRMEHNKELLVASNERWSINSKGEPIGEITYKSPISRLDAEAKITNPELLIVCCAILWMNRESFKGDG